MCVPSPPNTLHCGIYTYQVIETQYTLRCSGKGHHVMYFQVDLTCFQTLRVYVGIFGLERCLHTSYAANIYI